jgi:hypothetical protein
VLFEGKAGNDTGVKFSRVGIFTRLALYPFIARQVAK